MKIVPQVKLTNAYIERVLEEVRGKLERARFDELEKGNQGISPVYLGTPHAVIAPSDLIPAGSRRYVHDKGYELWRCANYEQPKEPGWYRVTIMEPDIFKKGESNPERYCFRVDEDGTWFAAGRLTEAVQMGIPVYYLPWGDEGAAQ